MHGLHAYYARVLHRPPPPPRTQVYVRHYRAVFAVVVLGYLTYNIVDASRGTPPNYYEVLGVTPDADDGALKAAFRQFAKKSHPDRVGAGGEELFMQVRDAFESLKDPVRRFAYDRFGPDALDWSTCTTVRDYMEQGMMQSIGFHVVTIAVLLAMSTIGKPSPVAFWRYLLYLSIFLAELALILGPSSSSSALSSTGDVVNGSAAAETGTGAQDHIFTFLFPRRVAYQHVSLLHQLLVFFSVAISRVAPVLFPVAPLERGILGPAEQNMMSGALAQISALSQAVDRELVSLLHTELHSIHPSSLYDDTPSSSSVRFGNMRSLAPADTDPAVMARLTSEMEDLAVETRLRRQGAAPGPLRGVIDAALARMRPQLQRLGSRKTLEWWERALPGAEDAAAGQDAGPRLPSPVSPVPGTVRLPSPPPQTVLGMAGGGSRSAAGKGQGGSYIRGRSVSC